MPKTVKPIDYELEIKTYLSSNPLWPGDKNDTFEGIVIINFQCIKSTKKIVFHAGRDLKLDLKSITLKDLESNNIPIIKTVRDLENDKSFVQLNLEKKCLKDDVFTLSVLFSGRLNTKLSGYYKSSYKDANKIRR